MLNSMGLKSRNVISLPLDIPNVDVSCVNLNEFGDYIITVESMQVGAICQHCGRKITKFHGHGRWIELRHLSILGHRVYIRLRPKQYECSHCGGRITTQALDWYETRSPHTGAYDRLFDYSPELKLAYTFREELTAIFEMPLTKEEAKKRLIKWADKVRSVPTPLSRP